LELAEIEVTGRKSLTLPWEEVQIMPIGDAQVGSKDALEDRLKRHVAWGMEQGNVYFLGMGDYIDLASPSNRKALRSAKLYDVVLESLQDKAKRDCERFLELVKGSEGRWLGLLEGHHYYEFEDGTTSDTIIAQRLGCAFLGSCAFVRLVFKRNGRGGKRGPSLKCTLWAHHGAGNGLTPWSPLNRLYHIMHTFDADVYLIGHQTKKPAVKVPRIYMSDVPPYRLIAKNKILAGTGGFSTGYTQGSRHYSGARPQGGYVEQRMLTPVATGGVVVKARPVHTAHYDRIDLNVEI